MKRLFRGLRDRGPAPRYDAVVIGGGIGGLLAGLLLARDGRKVLLVEQHYMVGGFCSTFRRGGYTFEAATHFYPLLGNPESWPGRLMRELGVTTQWVKMDPVDTFHLPDGSRFEVPADFETYRERLDARFPHEREALDAFFAEVRDAYMLGLLYYFRGRRTQRFGSLESLTVRQVLDRHFRDPALKLVLTADCPHWGGPPERTSFVFDSMLRLSYFLGNYFPVGGSQAFADELARCFEEHGGDILMSTRAKAIEVAAIDGAATHAATDVASHVATDVAGPWAPGLRPNSSRVTGVQLETDRGPLRGAWHVDTEAVVSNGDLRSTVESLLPEGSFDPAYLQHIKALRPSFPCFLSHIGVRGVGTRELERAQGYYWNGWDPDLVGRGGLRCKIFVPTLYEPSLAPEGCHIIILQKVLDLDYAAIDDWPRHKAGIERYVVDHLCRTLPGLEKQIEVQLSASAHTSWRFTGNYQGAMLGWEMAPDQLGEHRPPLAGPVDGLHLVGHWTRPGGGIVPVMVSAIEVASRLGVAQPDLSMPAPALARMVG